MKAKHTNLQKSYVFADPICIVRTTLKQQLSNGASTLKVYNQNKQN